MIRNDSLTNLVEYGTEAPPQHRSAGRRGPRVDDPERRR